MVRFPAWASIGSYWGSLSPSLVDEKNAKNGPPAEVLACPVRGRRGTFRCFCPLWTRFWARRPKKCTFWGFGAPSTCFSIVKWPKSRFCDQGPCFFDFWGSQGHFMWSGLPPGLPLDPSGGHWGPLCGQVSGVASHWILLGVIGGSHVSIDLPWLRAPIGGQIGPFGPIGGPIGPFGTPIGGQLGLLGPQLRGQLGHMGPQLEGQLGL